MRLLLPVFCFLVFSFYSSVLPSAFAITPEPPPEPQGYVTDLAGIVRDDMKMQLEQYLRELDQKTGAQIFILTVQSLDGEDIAGFSIRMAEKWKPGRKGKDNGVLMTVALKEKKYRIETGYGVEGILPDSFVGSLGREHLVPYFRKGDYSSGIFSAALAITQKIAAAEGVRINGAPRSQQGQTQRGRGLSLFHKLAGMLILIAAVILFIKNPGLFLLLFLGSSRNSGWGGGGGFGDGGFGGGGGGSFGGGGASGDW